MLRIAPILGALVLLATPALADMCSTTTKEKAEQAVKLIPRGSKMVEYCGHCKPLFVAATYVVDAVSEHDTGDEYKVVVNKDTAKPVEPDLGYTYVLGGPNKKAYVNLGALLKCWEAEGGDASDYEYKVLPDRLVPKGPVLPPPKK